MITFGCPQCNATINAPESETGKQLQCPQCKAPVVVPAAKSKTLLILAVVGGLVMFGCALMMCVGFAAVSVLGQKASGTFTPVGQTIGGS